MSDDRLVEWFRRNTNAGSVVSSVMDLFGAGEMMDTAPGLEEDRGCHFVYQNKTLTPVTAHDYNQNPINYVLFTGIDTNGKKYLTNYSSNVADTLVGEHPIVTYHYKTTPRQRGEDFTTIYQSEAYFSEEANEVAQRIFESKSLTGPNQPTIFITHSFGGIFQKMVLNALSQKSLDAFEGDRDKARAFMKQFSSINFGIRPPWKSGHTTLSPYLDIQRECPELYVAAIDDMLPHTPPYVLKIYCDVLDASSERLAYTLFRHEGDSDCQFFAQIGPGIVPATNNSGLRNFGGHNLPHYLEALGFSGNTIDKNLYQLHQLINSMLENDREAIHSLVARNSSLIRHDNHGYEASDTDAQITKKVWKKRIENETPPWAQKGGHPFLK